MEGLHVEPHCLYREGEWMGSGCCCKGGALIQESEVPRDAQRRDGKRSQMEGDGAVGKMLSFLKSIQRLLGHVLDLPCAAKLLAQGPFVQTG